MIEHHDQKGYLRFAINLGNPVLTTLLPDGSPGDYRRAGKETGCREPARSAVCDLADGRAGSGRGAAGSMGYRLSGYRPGAGR